MSAPRRPRLLAAATATTALCAAAGCTSNKLESGYAYRPLNSSTVERRAFYADPYSLDARRAESEKRDAANAAPAGRRPGRIGSPGR